MVFQVDEKKKSVRRVGGQHFWPPSRDTPASLPLPRLNFEVEGRASQGLNNIDIAWDRFALSGQKTLVANDQILLPTAASFRPHEIFKLDLGTCKLCGYKSAQPVAYVPLDLSDYKFIANY